MFQFLYIHFLNQWYDLISILDSKSSTTLMNYGFSGDNKIKGKYEKSNKNRLSLYDFVSKGNLIRNKAVLEVGSGRGGGANYLSETYKPALYFGLDFAKKATEFCIKKYSKTGNLFFINGNSENLPFPDSRFDIVLNVESSHGYKNVNIFFDEVFRVLKPGGFFLYTDFRNREEVKDWKKEISKRFKIEAATDITGNVVKALIEDHDGKKELIDKNAPFWVRGIMYKFAALKETPLFNKFSSGEIKYFAFVIKKNS